MSGLWCMERLPAKAVVSSAGEVCFGDGLEAVDVVLLGESVDRGVELEQGG